MIIHTSSLTEVSQKYHIVDIGLSFFSVQSFGCSKDVCGGPSKSIYVVCSKIGFLTVDRDGSGKAAGSAASQQCSNLAEFCQYRRPAGDCRLGFSEKYEYDIISRKTKRLALRFSIRWSTGLGGGLRRQPHRLLRQRALHRDVPRPHEAGAEAASKPSVL